MASVASNCGKGSAFDEPAPTGERVHLGRARTKLRILVVPGLLGDILGAWVMPYAHGLARLEKYGYRPGYLWVSGSASSAYNAEILRRRLESSGDSPS